MDCQRVPPEFIQKWKEQRRHADLPAGDEEFRPLKHNPVTPAQSAEFWKLLRKELEVTVNALCEIGIISSVCPFGEEILRISLNDDGLQPIFTSTDAVLDGDRIRCSVLNGGIYYLNFFYQAGTGVVVQDIQRERDFMGPRKAAEYVLDRMLNILEWTRSYASGKNMEI
jgi:hypothetical protein